MVWNSYLRTALWLGMASVLPALAPAQTGIGGGFADHRPPTWTSWDTGWKTAREKDTPILIYFQRKDKKYEAQFKWKNFFQMVSTRYAPMVKIEYGNVTDTQKDQFRLKKFPTVVICDPVGKVYKRWDGKVDRGGIQKTLESLQDDDGVKKMKATGMKMLEKAAEALQKERYKTALKYIAMAENMQYTSWSVHGRIELVEEEILKAGEAKVDEIVGQMDEAGVSRTKAKLKKLSKDFARTRVADKAKAAAGALQTSTSTNAEKAGASSSR